MAEDGAGRQDVSYRVRLDRHGRRTIEASVRIGHEEAQGERAAAPVDDVFRLQVVPVQWAGLARADDDHLLGIDHAATLAEFRQAAISQGEKNEPVGIETAEAEIGDVPAEAPFDDPADRGAAALKVFGRPMREARQAKSMTGGTECRTMQNRVDLRALHGRFLP